MMHAIRAAIAAMIWCLAAMPAAAQTYTVDSLTPWSIGVVASAASGDTVFLNSADGYVNVLSGNGAKISGPYAYETVSIRCVDQGSNLCSNSNKKARVLVGRLVANTGRARTITTIGAYNGSGTVGAGTNETNATLDFPLSGWTASNQIRTFRLSLFWPIGDDASGASGAASSQYYVYVAAYPATPTTGRVGTITATVRRAVTIAKVSDLRFGSFIAPSSGTYALSVSTAGSRTGQGSIVLLPGTYGAAQFTIAGEPGTTLSVSVPATFTMTGPGAPLSVTLNPSLSGSQTVPGSGTLTLAAGGTFNVGAGQASGAYSGSFTVTIAYN